jgi:hypothetical protein
VVASVFFLELTDAVVLCANCMFVIYRFFAFHQCCWTLLQCGHAYSSIHLCVLVVGHRAEGKLACHCLL